MDAKITKNRLSRLLAYDWIKIVAIISAFILGWYLVFNATKTDMRPSQQFTVINYYCNDTLSRDFQSEYAKCKTQGVFSYEVMGATTLDLSTQDSKGATDLLEARFARSEGDVVFVPALDYPQDLLYEEWGTSAYPRTYADTFFNIFYEFVYPLQYIDDPSTTQDDYLQNQGFFADLENYLNKFYDGGFENGTLNEEKVKNNFLSRIKTYKDKRFKTDAEKKEGLKNEKARIQKLRADWLEFNGYLDAGDIRLEKMSIRANDGTVQWQGYSAVNLCPDESKSSLNKYLSYRKDEKSTAQDMYAMLLRFDDVEPGYGFEAVGYVNSLVRLAKNG